MPIMLPVARSARAPSEVSPLLSMVIFGIRGYGHGDILSGLLQTAALRRAAATRRAAVFTALRSVGNGASAFVRRTGLRVLTVRRGRCLTVRRGRCLTVRCGPVSHRAAAHAHGPDGNGVAVHSRHDAADSSLFICPAAAFAGSADWEASGDGEAEVSVCVPQPEEALPSARRKGRRDPFLHNGLPFRIKVKSDSLLANLTSRSLNLSEITGPREKFSGGLSFRCGVAACRGSVRFSKKTDIRIKLLFFTAYTGNRNHFLAMEYNYSKRCALGGCSMPNEMTGR
jgi:hypothetical protein